jgi:hypothetical protein
LLARARKFAPCALARLIRTERARCIMHPADEQNVRKITNISRCSQISSGRPFSRRPTSNWCSSCAWRARNAPNATSKMFVRCRTGRRHLVGRAFAWLGDEMLVANEQSRRISQKSSFPKPGGSGWVRENSPPPPIASLRNSQRPPPDLAKMAKSSFRCHQFEGKFWRVGWGGCVYDALKNLPRSRPAFHRPVSSARNPQVTCRESAGM